MSVHGDPSGGHRAVVHPRFLDAVRTDLAEMAKAKGTPYPSVAGLFDVLSLPGMWCVLFWRAANAFYFSGLRPLSRVVSFLNIVCFGAELHSGAIVAPGVVIPHPVGVGVARGTVIGHRVRIMRAVAMGGSGNPERPGHPVLGDDVWVMDGAKVFGPVVIGDRSIIGTSAVIADDIPPDMFVYGARKSDVMRPLADLGLADHAGSLTSVTVATAKVDEPPDDAPAVDVDDGFVIDLSDNAPVLTGPPNGARHRRTGSEGG